jgi:tetratricopeptide (TPR) repeat protein
LEQDIEQIKIDADTAFNGGDFEAAEKLYQDLLELNPDSVSAHYAIGTIALKEKSLQKAVAHLDQAAQLEPEAVDIAFNLATGLYMSGNRLGALVQLQRGAKYCQDDPVFCSRIAEMSIRLGEPAAAITLMSRLKSLTPDQQIIMANAHGMLGSWRESVGILKHLNKSLPNDAVIAEKLSFALGQLRDYPAAISAFERHLRLITPKANDYLRFADILLIAQNAKRCDQALDQAQELGEDGVELYILRARTARLRGDYDAVHVALNDALKRQSNHGQVWSMMAEMANPDQLNELIQRLQGELAQEEEIAKLNHHLQALLNYALADMQEKNEDYSGAAKSLRRANKLQNVALAMTNASYSAPATEKQFDELISNYDETSTKFVPVPESNDQSNTVDTGRDITPIFIVGMVRSGTTLVERILGQNQQIFSAGEQEGMEFVASHYHHLMRKGQLPKPADLNGEQCQALRTMYLEKLPEMNKPIFTDKLPHNFRQVGLILKLFPQARIIQMHRNKPDVCLSIYSRPFSAGHNYATHWPDIDHFYSQAERLMGHWSSLNSAQILDLNYEDLVTDPKTYAKKLIKFCGFEWQESYLDFHQSVSQSFTFSELQVRQPIATKRINRWQKYSDYLPELTALSTNGDK